MQDENSPPKFSPFAFDVWACPKCENMIVTIAYLSLRGDPDCPQCKQVKVGEYELRKAKG